MPLDPMTESDSGADLAPDQQDDFHADALKAYEDGYNKDRDNQDEAYKDLRMIAGEDHWDPTALQQRTDENRPVLVVNQCPQFVRQVTGDLRQIKPAVKITPIDEAASKNVAAKVLPGLVRYVEQRSDAAGIYFAAADQAAGVGIGHWMVTHEYAAGTTFNQELRIAPIPDGIAVVWDADAILPTREDATWCFVPYDMTRRAFEAKYKGKRADALTGSPECFATWFSDDHVRVAMVFHKVESQRQLAIFTDGPIWDVTDNPGKRTEAQKLGATIKSKPGFKVQRAVISATDVLEKPEDWPGSDIPVVPFIGEEVMIGRKVVRRGVIRVVRDVQRIFNYAISTQTEVVALQPKAPFIGTRKQFEKYADQWETANTRNWAFLEYEADPAAPPPQRAQPPIASAGLQELMQATTDAFYSTTGIYPASLGAKSNETSGKAIMARQREGDTGTFVYHDNFARALRRTGQIIVNMAPHIYDTARTIQIAGEDGKIDQLKINQRDLGPDAMEEVEINDITNGAYEVAVEMGPAYSTKREEAREGMLELIRTLGPEGSIMFIDLFVKMMDWPLSDKIAERAKALLPPAIQQKEAQESGEPPPAPMPPPPPTPEQQAMMQEEQQKNIELARKGELEDRKQQLEFAKLQLEQQRLMHEAQVAAAQPTEMPQDPRLDHVIDALEQLGAMVDVVAKEIQKVEGDLGKIEQSAAAKPAEAPQVNHQEIMGQVTQAVTDLRDQLAEQYGQHAQALASLIKAPRKTTLIKGANGRPEGAVSTIEAE